jgi:hypothetical protein
MKVLDIRERMLLLQSQLSLVTSVLIGLDQHIHITSLGRIVFLLRLTLL